MADEVPLFPVPTPTPGHDLTPIYTSYMFARVDTDITRLVFGDVIPGGGDPRFHTSFVIQTENAVRFAKLILELYDKNKEIVAKAQAGQAAQQGR
jgi:hypothetical protein